jgi:hypothetical protein
VVLFSKEDSSPEKPGFCDTRGKVRGNISQPLASEGSG